jgi:hypothetical protein
MTAQHPRTSIKRWRNIAISVSLLIVVGSGEGLTESGRPKFHVVPVYPELYRRARIQGEFTVELTAEGGRVSEVKIVSHDVIGPNGKVKNPAVMVQAIQAALGVWPVSEGEKRVAVVTVKFKLSSRLSSMPSYTYRVKDRLGDFPQEIEVEADLPEIQHGAVTSSQRRKGRF